jgi:3-dehydrosphinganine reductase
MLKIILAGILAIPCLLVALVTAPVIALLAAPSLLLLIFRKESSTPSKKPDHVIVAGGSSGIGLSVAQECIRRGIPRVTLLARNAEKLQQAKALLEKSCTSKQEVHFVSVSVSEFPALQKVAQEICPNPKTDRTILFNCAGISYTTEFEKVPMEQYKKLIETNQLGAICMVRAFLPSIHNGTIVLTSSAAAQVGVYGYTAYSPTKYALRGFAETLHAELILSRPNVHIQLAFPADTNTPGYEEEAKMMPEITKALNESAGLANPDEYV